MGTIINETVSASAYTQARKKLKHTAFKDLNNATLELFEAEAKLNLYKGGIGYLV